MNIALVACASAGITVAVILLRTWLGRHGYALHVVVVVKRPRKNPRLPTPKAGHVVMPLQLKREFEEMLRQGVTGIVSLQPVGDGTVTLLVEQTNPQGS